MKVQPTTTNKPQPTFGNKIFEYAKPTSYGKRIHGNSRGLQYDVYVETNPETKKISHKLYCVYKDNKWVKSFLRFFSGDKLHKEIRSKAK